MEIEVGEYVRTKDGYIAKIINIIEEDYQERGNVLYELNEEVFDDTEGFEEYSNYALPDQFTKHSKNIIDLIEVGDYVNGYKISRIDELEGKEYKKIFKVYDQGQIDYLRIWKGNDIKTILTHEQFEQNCYRLEETDGQI